MQTLKNYERKIRKHLESLSKDNIIDLYLQIKWEHDIALQQLEELGYGLGEVINRKPNGIEQYNYSFGFDDDGNIFIKDSEETYMK